MKLSKEQKEKLAETLSMPWGSVSLLCDGYRITLQVQRAKGMTYRVMTYVNGVFEGKWTSDKRTFPEQKFLRKSVVRLCSPAQKAKDEKLLGKRFVAKMSLLYSATVAMFLPDWASGKAAISHLCRVCESVEIAPPTESAA